MSIISSQDSGNRLDLWLSQNFPQYSRSSIRKLLDSGNVSVNEKTEYRPNYRVKEADVIEVAEQSSLERQTLPATKPPVPVSIVYKDDHLVVVDKPRGVKVHPISLDDHDTLLNHLYFQLADDLGEFGINLVNRIDKETSGLVVCAISPQAAHHYGNLFASGNVRKRYLAVVHGNWLARKGYEPLTDSIFLNYDYLKKVQKADPTHSEGEYAQTTFRFIDYSAELKASLLEVSPLTGRTHQIRVHLQQLGFSILGDDKYGGREYSRMMLHAYKLSLKGLNGEEQKFTSQIPEEFIEHFNVEQT